MSSQELHNPFGSSPPPPAALTQPTAQPPAPVGAATFMHPLATSASPPGSPAMTPRPAGGVTFYSVPPAGGRGAGPSVSSTASPVPSFHSSTVSPRYMGRTIGGLPIADTSRMKTLQDHVHEWLASGLAMWPVELQVDSFSSGADMMTSAITGVTVASAPPAIRQPSPVTPLAIVRLYMGAGTPPPPKWDGIKAVLQASSETGGVGALTLPSRHIIADMVRQNQWTRIDNTLPTLSTLLSALSPTPSCDSVPVASEDHTDFPHLTLPQLLFYARAQAAAMTHLGKSASALENIAHILSTLLREEATFTSKSPDASSGDTGGGGGRDAPQFPAHVMFALATLYLAYADALSSSGNADEAHMVLGSLFAHLIDRYFPSVELPLEWHDRTTQYSVADAALADPCQMGRQAVLAKVPRAAMTSTSVSVHVRALAGLQHGPPLHAQCVSHLMVAVGVRLGQSCIKKGLRTAPAKVFNALCTCIRGTDIEGDTSALDAAFRFTGSLAPLTAANRWIERGLPWYHFLRYLYSTGASADTVSMLTAELQSLPHWTEAMLGAAASSAPLASSPTSPDYSSLVPALPTPPSTSDLSPANANTLNASATLAHLLQGDRHFADKKYDVAQRSYESALDVAIELHVRHNPTSRPLSNCSEGVRYHDPVFAHGEDLIVTSTCLVVAALARRGYAPQSLNLLEAVVRSDIAAFGRPELLALLTGAYDLTNDAMLAVRCKRVIQAVCLSYGLEHLDPRVFRLAALAPV